MTSKKGLSDREKEVLLLISYEYTTQEIAEKLFLSPGTIATYRNKLFAKLSVKNSAGLIRKSFENRILEINEYGQVKLSEKLYVLDDMKK